ncbi:MAG: PqqD family protein [Deltaproteobacteria bacterium]|nr:PqqD family protein [Deltaproteobacteria bacterium]MBW2150108.1 PqqD family protein [Deltaproteobacteria bacterium]
MLEINQNDTFTLCENIFLQKITELGKYWVFNIDSGEHYSLNETSYWILEQIAEGLAVKDVLGGFLDSFEVDENQGKDDFQEIIAGFLNEGIIKRRGKNEKG